MHQQERPDTFDSYPYHSWDYCHRAVVVTPAGYCGLHPCSPCSFSDGSIGDGAHLRRVDALAIHRPGLSEDVIHREVETWQKDRGDALTMAQDLGDLKARC